MLLDSYSADQLTFGWSAAQEAVSILPPLTELRRECTMTGMLVKPAHRLNKAAGRPVIHAWHAMCTAITCARQPSPPLLLFCS